MARSSYDESLSRLLVHEGGYSNHPSDPGGPTNFGITLEDARRYWKPGATAADVRGMPVAVAKDIYKKHYWAPMRCDELPAGVDYAVFDYGVNSGLGRAGRVLKRIVGLTENAFTSSSMFTDALVAAINRQPPTHLISVICDERLAFLQGLSTWSVFGNGWGRRVREVRAAALAMAEKATLVVPADPGRAADLGFSRDRPLKVRKSGEPDLRARDPGESRDPVTTAPSVPLTPPLSPQAGRGGRPSVPAVTLTWRAALVALIGGAAHFLGAHPLLVAAAVVVGVALAFFVPGNLQGGD